MKAIINITASAFILCAIYIIGIYTVPSSQPNTAYAQDTEQAEPATTDASETDEAEEEDSYSYTAQPGDSYTKIARKAVQTYGINEGINLSGAQIIYAETQLTQAADSPFLEIGQEVEVPRSDVATWVERAQSLSEQEVSLWNVYVPLVDFNTDSVGE